MHVKTHLLHSQFKTNMENDPEFHVFDVDQDNTNMNVWISDTYYVRTHWDPDTPMYEQTDSIRIDSIGQLDDLIRALSAARDAWNARNATEESA